MNFFLLSEDIGEIEMMRGKVLAALICIAVLLCAAMGCGEADLQVPEDMSKEVYHYGLSCLEFFDAFLDERIDREDALYQFDTVFTSIERFNRTQKDGYYALDEVIEQRTSACYELLKMSEPDMQKAQEYRKALAQSLGAQ